jgi:hypothetical protein
MRWAWHVACTHNGGPVPALVKSYGICGGQNDIELGSIRVFHFPLPLIPPTDPYLSSSIIIQLWSICQTVAVKVWFPYTLSGPCWFTWRKVYLWKKFENKVLKRIFGSRRKVVTKGWRISNAYLYSSPDTLWEIRYDEIEGACGKLCVTSEIYKTFYQEYYREYHAYFNLTKLPKFTELIWFLNGIIVSFLKSVMHVRGT